MVNSVVIDDTNNFHFAVPALKEHFVEFLDIYFITVLVHWLTAAPSSDCYVNYNICKKNSQLNDFFHPTSTTHCIPFLFLLPILDQGERVDRITCGDARPSIWGRVQNKRPLSPPPGIKGGQFCLQIIFSSFFWK